MDGATDNGVQFAELNGDGIPDAIQSYQPVGGCPCSRQVWIAQQRPSDTLTTITHPAGGETRVHYKGSAEYLDGSSAPINTELPFLIRTVEHVVRDDGFGTTGTTTYSYGGGDYFYQSEYDRKFASFATTTTTDPAGNVTIENFHQGNGSQTAVGEYSDDFSKIGKMYREEIDDSGGNL